MIFFQFSSKQKTLSLSLPSNRRCVPLSFRAPVFVQADEAEERKPKTRENINTKTRNFFLSRDD